MKGGARDTIKKIGQIVYDVETADEISSKLQKLFEDNGLSFDISYNAIVRSIELVREPLIRILIKEAPVCIELNCLLRSDDYFYFNEKFSVDIIEEEGRGGLNDRIISEIQSVVKPHENWTIRQVRRKYWFYNN